MITLCFRNLWYISFQKDYNQIKICLVNRIVIYSVYTTTVYLFLYCYYTDAEQILMHIIFTITTSTIALACFSWLFIKIINISNTRYNYIAILYWHLYYLPFLVNYGIMQFILLLCLHNECHNITFKEALFRLYNCMFLRPQHLKIDWIVFPIYAEIFLNSSS